MWAQLQLQKESHQCSSVGMNRAGLEVESQHPFKQLEYTYRLTQTNLHFIQLDVCNLEL